MNARLTRIILSALLLAAGLLAGHDTPLSLPLFLAAYLMTGWDVLYRALRQLFLGQVFSESFLMSLATLGALILGEYAEAVAVMLLYQVGELFQAYALGRSRRSIAGLMDLRPDSANLMENGEPRQVSPEEVKTGDIILVRPGEKLPLDGVIVTGVSALDTAMLTGEALPRDVSPGQEVYSGAVNLSGPLTIRVSKPYSESTVSKILELVENASDRKSASETFITRFSAVYTPIVVALAALLAFLPALLFGQPLMDWVYRALNFLVVSCPCALVISIPLAFFGGLGGASRRGILVKGSNYLEALAQARTVVFDKTGTLTQGRFSLSDIRPAEGVSREHMLDMLAHAEAQSLHPLAQPIRAAYTGGISLSRVAELKETAGRGLSAAVDGRQVLAGSARWLEEHGISVTPWQGAGTAVHLALDGVYAGYVLAGDRVKDGAKEAVAALRALGIRHIALLSGDSEAAARAVAQSLGIEEVHHSLLPGDKVALVEAMLAQQPRGEKLVFAGDGINDAPVLARADIGIAMGALGSDAAIEAADIVLMDDNPLRLPQAIRLARKTLDIARQNAFFAISVKALVLALSAAGYASLWAAVFADVGVSILAVLNAMRTLKMQKNT